MLIKGRNEKKRPVINGTLIIKLKTTFIVL